MSSPQELDQPEVTLLDEDSNSAASRQEQSLSLGLVRAAGMAEDSSKVEIGMTRVREGRGQGKTKTCPHQTCMSEGRILQ